MNNFIKSVKIYLHQIKRYFFVFRSKKVTHKVILLSSGRSGSNLFTSLVNSHPDIFFDNERFHLKSAGRILFPDLYLNLLPRQTRCRGKKVYGIGLMTTQLLTYYKEPELKQIFEEWNSQGWKIIYLRRENIFDSSISYRRGQIDQEWLQSKSGNDPVRLEPKEVIDSMTYRLMMHKVDDNLLSNIDFFEVFYERDLKGGDWQGLMDRVFKFLEVDSVPVKSNLKKKTTAPLSKTISNFTEIENELKKAGFINYLYGTR